MKVLLCFAFLIGMTLTLHADPIKKEKPIDHEKLCKETFEAFWKAVKEGPDEDAIKLMDTPFRETDGKKIDNLDKFKQELARKPPQANELKATIIEVVEFKKVNEYLKKNKFVEISEDDLKVYEEVMGKDGRVVFMELELPGIPNPKGKTPKHMLFRFKEDKVKIVGFGGGN